MTLDKARCLRVTSTLLIERSSSLPVPEITTCSVGFMFVRQGDYDPACPRPTSWTDQDRQERRLERTRMPVEYPGIEVKLQERPRDQSEQESPTRSEIDTTMAWSNKAMASLMQIGGQAQREKESQLGRARRVYVASICESFIAGRRRLIPCTFFTLLTAQEAQQAGELMGHPRRSNPSLATGVSLGSRLWLMVSSLGTNSIDLLYFRKSSLEEPPPSLFNNSKEKSKTRQGTIQSTLKQNL